MTRGGFFGDAFVTCVAAALGGDTLAATNGRRRAIDVADRPEFADRRATKVIDGH